MAKTSGSAAIHSQATGPTFTKNDPAKFHGKGKTSGKTPANGVEEQKHGEVFHANSTHISTPNADKPAKESKLIAERSGRFSPVDTACDLTASQDGSGGPTDRAYALKKSYDKKGKTVSKGAREVF